MNWWILEFVDIDWVCKKGAKPIHQPIDGLESCQPVCTFAMAKSFLSWNSIRIIYFLSWEGFIRPKTDMVICFKSLRLATRCTYRLLKNSRGTLQHQFHNFVSQISSSRNNDVYNLNSHLFLTLFSWQFQALQPLVIKALAAISSRIYMVIC